MILNDSLNKIIGRFNRSVTLVAHERLIKAIGTFQMHFRLCGLIIRLSLMKLHFQIFPDATYFLISRNLSATTFLASIESCRFLDFFLQDFVVRQK